MYISNEHEKEKVKEREKEAFKDIEIEKTIFFPLF